MRVVQPIYKMAILLIIASILACEEKPHCTLDVPEGLAGGRRVFLGQSLDSLKSRQIEESDYDDSYNERISGSVFNRANYSFEGSRLASVTLSNSHPQRFASVEQVNDVIGLFQKKYGKPLRSSSFVDQGGRRNVDLLWKADGDGLIHLFYNAIDPDGTPFNGYLITLIFSCGDSN